MKTTKTTRWLPALLALALILTACPNPAGSDDPLPLLTPPTPTVTSVTITPAKVSIAKGKSRNFTATVIGTNNPSQAVTWTIVFDGMYDRETTITEDGRLDIASDETADTTFMVKATSKANVSKWGTATVTVYATEADIPKTVENVTVAPVGTTVTKGQTHQFSATVEGTKLEAADKNVTWTVAPQNTGTGIDTTGMLTVAANDPATTLTVTATSVFDPTMSGFVTVTLAGNNPGYLGNRLDLSGQVYTGGLNPADFSISYQKYDGSMNIIANNGGAGSITGGQLTYSIGTPNSLSSVNVLLSEFFYDVWDNVHVSNTNAQIFTLDYPEVDSPVFYDLLRTNQTISVNGNVVLITRDDVQYMYVDRDVTISGKGKISGNGYSTQDLNLAFNAGWNAIHLHQVTTVNMANYASTYVTTLTLGNPDNLKWVLNGGGFIGGDPNTLVIQGIPQTLIEEMSMSTAGGLIGLFSFGTTVQQALAAVTSFSQTGDWGIIDVGNFLYNASIASQNNNYASVTIPLYKTGYGEPWTGGGQLMVGMMVQGSSGTKFFWTGPVNFSSTTTTITYNPDWEVDISGGGGVPISSAPLGEELILSGQVHTWDGNDSNSFPLFHGNLPVSSGVGGSGSVINGRLNFTVGTPAPAVLKQQFMQEFLDDAGGVEVFPNIQTSPADVQGTILMGLYIDNYQKPPLWRFNETVVTSGTSTTQTQEIVFYIYVNKDATLTATAMKETGYDVDVSDINMSLKKGWNAMYLKTVITTTQSGDSGSTSISAANPSNLIWVAMGSDW